MIDQLIKKIIDCDNPSCVGLDTCVEYLPDALKERITSFESAANAIFEFNKNIIDKICDIVPAVKVQVAYYEMYSHYGMKAFYDTLIYAKAKGLIVISDVKRNDIGSTAGCYAKAYLGVTDLGKNSYKAFPSDYVTVNAYLGSDGIKPFTGEMQAFNKGAFVLLRTSNPSGAELQNLKLESGLTVYEHMAALIEEWGKDSIGEFGYSSLGAVVGATNPGEAARLRRLMPHTFFLIPGYGFQGGSAEDLKVSFNNGLGGIVNSSRGILCAYKSEKYKDINCFEAARLAALDMKADINRVIKDRPVV